MMADDEKPPGKDLMVIAGPEGPGGWIPCVRHRPDHTVTIGALKPMKDGDPIGSGEIVSLKEGDGPVHEVETLWSGSDPGLSSDPEDGHGGKGPAMVNSKAYGDGWERIFGSRQKVGEA